MPFDVRPGVQSVGLQLGQSRPGNTTAASLYSPADGVQTKIVSITVCNTTASGAAFRLFHDEDGTTYDQTTALWYDAAIAANTTVELEIVIFMVGPDGNLAIRTDTADALTFTVYGEETQVRAR